MTMVSTRVTFGYRTGRTARSLVALVLALTLAASGSALGADPGYAAPTVSSSGADVTAAPSAQAATDACNPVSSGSERSDPATDTLGWENGCWYDASIRIDQSDGLNATELDAFLARTMARVEVVRRLEFEASPRVEIISRDTFTDRIDEELSVGEAEHLRKNVKWEALMMIGEAHDAVGVRRATAGTAGAFYSPSEERIVVVSADRTAPKIDELTLAHELVHLLQNQHFDVADRFDLATFEQRRTTDSLNAINSLLEGDAELVRMRYRDRCDAAWTCVPRPEQAASGSAADNTGMNLVTLYPYYDGPKFVNVRYNVGGWQAVNAVYEDPPTTTEAIIYPDTYPAEKPTTVSYTDTSTDRWSVPDVDTGQPNYVSVGQAGMTGMMVYTLLDGNSERPPVIPSRAVFNFTDGQLDPFDILTFENDPYASGWQGDVLYPYVTDRSSTTGETGYVWKIAFESENDSAEFVEGYTKLLAYHNASAVDGYANTYRIPDENEFGDAYYIERSGSTVYVVNAPSVAELSELRAGAAPREGDILDRLPFADEPVWVPLTIFALLATVVVLTVRLLFALRDGSTGNSEAR